VLRVLIAGGGTGGHLFPGIAVAEELVRRVGAQVRFVGSEHGLERSAVPKAGFEVDLLKVRGVRGEGAAGVLRAAWRVPASIVAALRLLRRHRPDLVIGVGGYSSFPASAAALALRTPLVLLEQNSSPGAATRLLAPFARRICVSFAETAQRLRGRTILTGNPVRGLGRAASLATEPAASRGEMPRVLIFGGSAGAHRLNVVVPEAMAKLGGAVSIVHQTGARDRDEVAEAYRRLGAAAEVHAFIDDMLAQYASADLVVCRAGATTIAELTALGVAAVLVPYPFAAGDHQRLNAQTLVDAGAAWMVLDRELEPERLAALVREALADPAILPAVRERARALGHPDAAARVAEVCLAVVGAAARKEDAR
jgi:UDP-N-acetylglucosamine--N-acetylmuramyl-(pentapeptide) pyrophosphoryl-undecaprenol N-acetylglucosamine transferase